MREPEDLHLDLLTLSPLVSRDPAAQPTIGVVVPARNAERTIVACLDAIVAASDAWPSRVAIVVVDNESTDATPDLIRARSRTAPQLTLVSWSGSGVGGVRNAGAAHLTTDLIAFVDADCVIAVNHLSAAWAVLSRTGADAVGYPYSLPEAPGWIEETWEGLHRPPSDGVADWLYAGNLVIRRTAFVGVGGFDAELPSGEDPDLGRRMRAAGFRLYQDSSIRAVHLGNPTALAPFFRQQWWHGLGMWRSGPTLSNRPLIMTLVHAIATGGFLVAVVLGWPQTVMAGLAALVATQAAVPTVTVAFRLAAAERRANPLAGVVLYWVYYWARIAALSSSWFGLPKPPRGRS